MDNVTTSQGPSGTLLKVLSFTAEKTLELANANSVVGEKIFAGDITVIPVSKLSVGFAGGGADMTDAAKKQKRNPAGAGAKVTLTPMSFLVIKGSDVRVMNVAVGKPTTAEAIISAVIAEAEKLLAAKKEKKDSEAK